MSTNSSMAIEVAEEAFEICNACCCAPIKPKSEAWQFSTGTLEENYRILFSQEVAGGATHKPANTNLIG